MTSIAIRLPAKISLRAPVITMVLAATAVPIEFRPLGDATLRFGLDVPDILANVAGYVPVGIVLGGSGALRAIVAAACVATAAEASQIVMMHREPSLIDVATNVLGAILGFSPANAGRSDYSGSRSADGEVSPPRRWRPCCFLPRGSIRAPPAMLAAPRLRELSKPTGSSTRTVAASSRIPRQTDSPARSAVNRRVSPGSEEVPSRSMASVTTSRLAIPRHCGSPAA